MLYHRGFNCFLVVVMYDALEMFSDNLLDLILNGGFGGWVCTNFKDYLLIISW